MSRKLSITQALTEGSDTGLLDLSARQLRTFPMQAREFCLDEITELGVCNCGVCNLLHYRCDPCAAAGAT